MPRKPTQDELNMINQYYAKVELGADDLWVLDVLGAKAQVQTAYFSFLTTRSIQNFVMDVNAKVRNGKAPAVGFYLNHDTNSRLPMGALFDAQEQGEEKDLEFVHKVFLPANYSTGDITSDDYVRSVELGMSEQVSVGFISNKMICNLCQNDIRSSKCPHYPGSRYNVGTEEEPKFEICTFSVDEARLLEESAAWKGALPGARILCVGNSESGKTENKAQNIKDFPEGSYLKFNCSGEGSIEVAFDLDVDINTNGGILMSKKDQQLGAKPETETQASEQSPEAETPEEEIDTLALEIEELRARNLTLEEEVAGLKTENAGLKQQLSEKDRALGTQKAIADAYIAEIREEIHKLSVGIDANAYNKENLNALLDKFNLDELKAHKVELRKRLSSVVGVGRSTIDEGGESSLSLESSLDKSCFKIGR